MILSSTRCLCTLTLCVWIIEALGLGRPLLYGPSTALEGDIVEFQCEVFDYPKEEDILFQLFKEGNSSKVLAHYSSLSGDMANFPLIVTSSYEGNLECVVSVQNDSTIEATVSDPHYFTVVDPVEGAQLVVQSGPVQFFEGKTLSLRCDVTRGTHVSYGWLVNGRPVPKSTFHYHAQNQLFIYRTSLSDSGLYMCLTSNRLNETAIYTSNSSAVLIMVKELVSDPDISFAVLKKDQNYSAVVTCQSIRGTPPINFTLHGRTELVSMETVEDLTVTLTLPVVLDQHMDWLQCGAANGDQIAYSRWIALHVVSVQGPVVMNYDYDVGENHAVHSVRFYCKVPRGTFPRYRWFLNGTVLEGRGSFYWVVHQPPEQSILLLSVGERSAGTYHCDVSDSFDNTTVVKSEELYMDKEVLNKLPTSVVAVVFGCFVFLITLVTTCCCVGGVYRRRHYGAKYFLSLEMDSMALNYNDEMDVDAYNEDADIVSAARIAESDKESLESKDEWGGIEETLNLHEILGEDEED